MKKKIVYFLGAGASKNFGYPLTNEIMPEILRYLINHDLFNNASNSLDEEKEQEKDLKDFIDILYPGLKDIDPIAESNRIPNITEVLSMVEYCCFYNLPPHPSLCDEKLFYFRDLLNRGIAEILRKYISKDVQKHNNKFLSFKKQIKDKIKNEDVTIITTNYDLLVDKLCDTYSKKNKVDFGISYRDVKSNGIILPVAPNLRYYKIHGSMNWLKCDQCGYYYINHDGSISHQAFIKELTTHNTCICNSQRNINYKLKLKSILVAPSLIRDIRDSNLLQIWKASLEAIRTADKLIIIGYSFPSEDLGIKSIFMRGINGREENAEPIAIDVVQMGYSAETNYYNIFGNNIKYYHQGLDYYLENIHAIS